MLSLATALICDTKREVAVTSSESLQRIGVRRRRAFRFDAEFDEALQLLAVEPAFDGLVSAVVPVEEAESAFTLAADRGRSCKVLLDFGG